MRVWNPRPEPPDPYDLNHHGLEPMMAVLGIIPVYGLAVTVGGFIFAASEWWSNEYNLANEAWNTAVFATAVQLGYLLAYLLGLGVINL